MTLSTFGVITGLAAALGLLSASITAFRHIKQRLLIAKPRRPLFEYWQAVQNAKFKVAGKRKPWNFFLLELNAYFKIILAPALTDLGETGLEVASVVTDTHDIFVPFIWIRDHFSRWLSRHKKLQHLFFHSENYETLRENIRHHQKMATAKQGKITIVLRKIATDLAEELDLALRKDDEEVPFFLQKAAASLTEGLSHAIKKNADGFQKTAIALTEGLNQAIRKNNIEFLQKKLAELESLGEGKSCPIPEGSLPHHRPRTHHNHHKKH